MGRVLTTSWAYDYGYADGYFGYPTDEFYARCPEYWHGIRDGEDAWEADHQK